MRDLVTLLGGFRDLNNGLKDEEARSVAELSQLTGRGPHWVRERLKGLIRQGLVEVTRKETTKISGGKTVVPAYRIKADKAGEE